MARLEIRVRNESASGVFHPTEESGVETLAGGTASVSFSEVFPDATYSVLLSSDADETMRWSDRAVTGFTITSSNGSSTAQCSWRATALGE
jgi:hypothetical protein